MRTINAGFTHRTATKIAGYVRDNGLTLDEVFVIHGDPDYYFGLEQIFRAYPGVVAINLWDAENSVLVGGIDVFNELHVFLADTATREKLTAWLDRLEAFSGVVELGAKVLTGEIIW